MSSVAQLNQDCFIQKCPSCGALLRKKSLHDEHPCDCGYVWEGALDGHDLRPRSNFKI